MAGWCWVGGGGGWWVVVVTPINVISPKVAELVQDWVLGTAIGYMIPHGAQPTLAYKLGMASQVTHVQSWSSLSFPVARWLKLPSYLFGLWTWMQHLLCHSPSLSRGPILVWRVAFPSPLGR